MSCEALREECLDLVQKRDPSPLAGKLLTWERLWWGMWGGEKTHSKQVQGAHL